MCGIAGYIGYREISSEQIGRTLNLMKRRGPDNQKPRHYRCDNTHLYLLHSRLSIIDVDHRADQPFEDDGYVVVFNGEIYNYVELRQELRSRGHSFHTDSDTEVLLKGYIEFGDECVHRFEGMWAFAIWDPNKKKLLLSRDRFAEKPLYIFRADNGIYFGSETRFIRALCNDRVPINQKHILRNLVLGYKSLHKSNETFYQGIFQIEYSTNVNIFPDISIKKSRYWSPENFYTESSISLEQAIEGARHWLLESMRIRLRADVPLAFCLSGGVDSASLVSIAVNHFRQDVTTFSIIDADERYNEYPNIIATVNDTNCKNTLINLTDNDVLTKLTKLIRYHDAPVATITYFVHSLLSEAMSDQGYKISVSGTAADEIFSGYYDHFLLHLYEVGGTSKYYQHLTNWKNNLRPFVRNPVLTQPDLYRKDPKYRKHIYDSSDEFREFLKIPLDEEFYENNYVENLFQNRMMNELFHESTPLILHEDDLNSMCFSIENRSPFLDKRLYEFMASIPREYLIQDGYGKFILRQAMRGIVNDQVLFDRRKKGFNASINTIFDFNDEDIREVFVGGDSQLYDLIDRKKVSELFENPIQPNNYSKFLFSFLSTKIFLDESERFDSSIDRMV